VSYSADESYHIGRLKDRLRTPEVQAAFSVLFGWAETSSRLYIYPISRGAFSAVHLSTKRNARHYADCEFGFKGASKHIRWYFRKPGFESGLFTTDLIRSHFECDINIKASEMMVNIRTASCAQKIIDFTESRLSHKSCHP